MTTTGSQIGPYTLGACLGQGGFGAVYEATHQETGQRVAIKFLHESKQLLPEVQNRFVREVSLLKRLDHENIVSLFDAGLHEGMIYCTMELVECGSLKEILSQRQTIPWREAVEVAVQICHALDHAHQRGCVHRDLKPANLYLSEDGVVKLGDMGLARDLDSSRLTASGQTVGTWRYMPPEQIMGLEQIDGRLDLYALACILFEMIAGRVPFEGPNFASIFDQHLEAPPPRLDVVADDCPKPLADLVDQMLEKEPVNRPESAGIVAERLRVVLTGKSTGPSEEASSPDNSFQSDSTTGQPNLTSRLQGGPKATEEKKTTRGLGFAVVLALLLALLLLAINSCN